jgi:class 3 adenylate cyclase
MLVCAQCGRENADDARFCSNCGSPLGAAAPADAREERKVVTILFADLVGFTSQAEQLDPEDVRATLSPYYALLRSELERHGGTVEKFIGDAVVGRVRRAGRSRGAAGRVSLRRLVVSYHSDGTT